MDYIVLRRINRIRRRIAFLKNRRILYEIRLKSTPLHLEEFAFRKRFRLPKTITRELIDKLRPFSSPSCIPFEIQVLTALNFYAQGSYQGSIGSNHLLGLSQPSVSRSIKIITTLIVEKLMPTIIRFPQTIMESMAAQQGFNDNFDMSYILGAVDGTHVPIVAPPEMSDIHRGNLYINRKGYHSLNVLTCCDSNMRITYANARFPGSVHDFAVWLVSELRSHFRNQFSSVQTQESFLIGDSGFPLEPWLLTPCQNAVEGTREHWFNKKHTKARQIVERCFGVLKNRFRCLMTHRVLHYSPYMAGMIVYAVMCLHNICVENSVDDREDMEEEESVDESNSEETQWHSLGQQCREKYISNLHHRLTQE